VQIRIAEKEYETHEDPTVIKGASYNRWNEQITKKNPVMELPY
jgi:putative sterol carrier protein